MTKRTHKIASVLALCVILLYMPAQSQNSDAYTKIAHYYLENVFAKQDNINSVIVFDVFNNEDYYQECLAENIKKNESVIRGIKNDSEIPKYMFDLLLSCYVKK